MLSTLVVAVLAVPIAPMPPASAAPPASAPATGVFCRQYGEATRVIGEGRDAGLTQEVQEAMIRRQAPTVNETAIMFELAIVKNVYDHPTVPPEMLQAITVDICSKSTFSRY